MLADTAAGIPADTAAAGLIIAHGHLLHDPAFRRIIAAGAPVTDRQPFAVIRCRHGTGDRAPRPTASTPPSTRAGASRHVVPGTRSERWAGPVQARLEMITASQYPSSRRLTRRKAFGAPQGAMGIAARGPRAGRVPCCRAATLEARSVRQGGPA
jgi:hypothetical protein